ncbi:helix-turn-helix domain-containing protein [Spartinivicinus poritis]
MSKACKMMGVSRDTFYRYHNLATVADVAYING